jgi:UDP-galactopyranose mutase
MEFKHLTAQKHSETPWSVTIPYPMAILITHAALVAVESNVYFAGRLAQYRYYNMD